MGQRTRPFDDADAYQRRAPVRANQYPDGVGVEEPVGVGDADGVGEYDVVGVGVGLGASTGLRELNSWQQI